MIISPKYMMSGGHREAVCNQILALAQPQATRSARRPIEKNV